MKEAPMYPNVRAFAGELVKHFPGYVLAPMEGDYEYTNRAKLIREDGAGVSLFSSYAEKGRICVSGYYPHLGGSYSPATWNVVDYQYPSPEIKVNPSRGVEVVARDIQRRFLTEYEDLYLKCLKRKEESEDYTARMQECARAVLKALGKGAEGRKMDSDSPNVWMYNGHKLADFERFGPDRVRVTLELTREQAISIAEWVASQPKEKDRC